MKQKLSLPFLALMLLNGCQAQKSEHHNTKPSFEGRASELSDAVRSTFPQEQAAAGILRLKEGQNIFVKEAQMNITFTQAVQDSRCPMNARCVSAGSATIEIEAMTTTSRPAKFKISVGDLRNGLVNAVVFSGYRIQLDNLYPSNSTDTGFEQLKGRYVADLKIEKITN